MKQYHVTKKGDKWRFEEAGSNRAILQSDKKADLLGRVQLYMTDRVGSVTISKENGVFQEERTYQHKDDPRRTKG